MIQIFHRFKKSIGVGLVISAVCLVMSGFGVDFMMRQNQKNYAIKVGDKEVTHSEFYEEKRAIEDNYRRMLGEAYAKFADNLTAKLNEQLSERMISDALLDRFAKKQELYVGENEVQTTIMTELFGGNFSPAQYTAYLKQIGKSAGEFENKIASEAVRNQLTRFFGDISRASTAEAKALFEREEMSVSVKYLEYSPAAYVAQVKDPTEDALKDMYDRRAAEYEEPAKVSYQYVVFDPATFENDVNVAPEDVEFYYSENESKFMNPEEVHARHILLNYKKDSKPEEMAKIKEKAEELRAKLQAGEPFEALAQQSSEDFTTSMQGGDLGWIKKGTKSKEFDSVAFKLPVGQVSDVVSADYGFEIIKVEERKDAAAKPLEEVRAQIESQIKKAEAPAYAKAKADELYDQWTKSTKSLSEFVAAAGLSVQASAGLLTEASDPSPLLKGLTKEVLTFADNQKQLVELKERMALVQVAESREPTPPSFAELKPKLLEAYKQEEAKKLASQSANEAVASFKSAKFDSVEALAKEAKLELKEIKDLKQAAGTGVFADQDVKRRIFVANAVNQKPEEVYENGGKFYVLQVKSLKLPDETAFKAKAETYVKRATEQMGQELSASLVNALKAQTQIDVDPSIMGQS